MTKITYLEPEWAQQAKGEKHPDAVKRVRYRNAVIVQRRQLRSAFSVSFMEWVGQQLMNRGMSRRELAMRAGLPIGTVTTHFKNPAKVHVAYVPTYLYGLGVRLQFTSVPLQFLEEHPGFQVK